MCGYLADQQVGLHGQEAVVGQPASLKILARYPTAVGKQDHDQVAGAGPLGDPQGRHDRHSAGASDHKPLLAGSRRPASRVRLSTKGRACPVTALPDGI